MSGRGAARQKRRLLRLLKLDHPLTADGPPTADGLLTLDDLLKTVHPTADGLLRMVRPIADDLHKTDHLRHVDELPSVAGRHRLGHLLNVADLNSNGPLQVDHRLRRNSLSVGEAHNGSNLPSLRLLNARE